VQANLNQFDTGPQLLDTAIVRQERLTMAAAAQRPDCIVMAESALLTYLDRRPGMRRMVQGWSNQAQSPLIIGSLHWEIGDTAAHRQYNVYNTAFFVKPDEPVLDRYFKIKLVPFSETLPFEGLFPMLSRVNLGESDFKEGSEPVTFRIGDSIGAVPFVCYEIIYPGFVRSRLDSTATTLVNITNDGWFGRTSGPFHHAAMARMRSIENGISLVRCANSGISMLVDPLGRVISKTPLYEEALLIGEVPLQRIPTLYTQLGEWPLGASGFIVVLALALLLLRRGVPVAPASDDASASAE
jgi:apolipoprotein N-acyltransferase